MQPTPSDPIRILLVATSYPADSGDWRGVFIGNLAAALARRPDVALSIWAPPGERSPAMFDAVSDGDRRWLADLMRRGGIAHLLRTQPLQGMRYAIGLLLRLRGAYRRRRGSVDVLHCNWLQTMLPAPRRLPVLVGVLGSDMKLLRWPMMTTLLRLATRGRAVTLCPNAGWMETELRARFGRHARVLPIPFGIDAGWFAIERRVDALAPPRWLVVSRLTHAKLGDLLAWGAPMFEGTRRELHLFGPMQETIVLPSWIRYHGPATPRELRDVWFPQACGLLTLSRHSEGRPQVMLEAMAAGLPVVASALPAHMDFIEHDRTGWICHSPADLARGLVRLERSEECRRIGSAARAWAREAIGSWDDCAARYVAAYRSLLGEAE